jgi:hypothetical protein
MRREERMRLLGDIIQHAKHRMDEARGAAPFSDLAYEAYYKASVDLKAAEHELWEMTSGFDNSL